MGWATKTNCDTPRPTLGNPRSLVPKIERTPAAAELAFLSLGNYLASPERHPAPVAARPYTDVITLTDADDLADHLPSVPAAPDLAFLTLGNYLGSPERHPASVAARPYTDVITLTDADDIADHFPSTPVAPDVTTQPVATITADSALPTPCLSPAGTSLIEPDNVLSGGASAGNSEAYSETDSESATKMIPFTTNGIISGIIRTSTPQSGEPRATRLHLHALNPERVPDHTYHRIQNANAKAAGATVSIWHFY